MREPDRIEFLTDGLGPDDAGAPEDVLAIGSRSRRIRLVVALGAVGLIVGTVLVHQHSDSGPGAVAPTRTPVTAGPSSASLAVRPPAEAATLASDVAVSAVGGWVLRDATLLAVRGTRVLRSVDIPELLRDGLAGQPRLALDTGAGKIWVVLENGLHSRMLEFDASSLRRVGDVSWTTSVDGAAALDGHLYLSTEFGVADLAPGSTRPGFIAGLAGAVGAIAADPTRHRLILLDLGFPTDAWTYRPGRIPVEADGNLAFSNATLVIAGGAIWVSGQTAFTTVIERLDPISLRPVGVAPIAGQLGRGTVLAGGGAGAFWIRGNGVVVCADAATGRAEQRWDITAASAVASNRTGALVATTSGFFGLTLAGCSG